MESESSKAKEPKFTKVINPCLGNKGVGGYLVYHVNEGLSVVPTEVADHFIPVLAHHGYLHQRNDFGRGEGTTS